MLCRIALENWLSEVEFNKLQSSPPVSQKDIREISDSCSLSKGGSVLGFFGGGKMKRQERRSKALSFMYARTHCSSFPTMARTNCLCPRMVVGNHFGSCKERTAKFWETMSLWQRLYWKHHAMWYQVLQTYKPPLSRQALPHLVHLPPGGQGSSNESCRLIATMWTKDTIYTSAKSTQTYPSCPSSKSLSYLPCFCSLACVLSACLPFSKCPWPWPWNASGRQQRA